MWDVRDLKGELNNSHLTDEERVLLQNQLKEKEEAVRRVLPHHAK